MTPDERAQAALKQCRADNENPKFRAPIDDYAVCTAHVADAIRAAEAEAEARGRAKGIEEAAHLIEPDGYGDDCLENGTLHQHCHRIAKRIRAVLALAAPPERTET